TVKLMSTEIDVATNQQVSSAAALFEASVVYKDPPPPVVVVVQPPPPPAPPPPPEAPKKPPVAKFKKSGEAYVTAPANHVFKFTDASTKGSGTITTWLWNFGDGTTYNGKNPPAHTFRLSNSSENFTVTLTVTDSN